MAANILSVFLIPTPVLVCRPSLLEFSLWWPLGRDFAEEEESREGASPIEINRKEQGFRASEFLDNTQTTCFE